MAMMNMKRSCSDLNCLITSCDYQRDLGLAKETYAIPSSSWRKSVLSREKHDMSDALVAHKMTQQPPPSLFSNMSSDALVAASNTSSTPSPVKLEHSRYLRAPISFAACSPSVGVINLCDFFRISSMATGSSRRSFFSPTRMIGTSGHLSCASVTHCITHYLGQQKCFLLSPLRSLAPSQTKAQHPADPDFFHAN